MMILVGLLVAGLGAALRVGEAGSTAGVNTHQVGAILLVAGALEFGLALWLRLKSRVRTPQPVRIEEPGQTDDYHTKRAA